MIRHNLIRHYIWCDKIQHCGGETLHTFLCLLGEAVSKTETNRIQMNSSISHQYRTYLADPHQARHNLSKVKIREYENTTCDYETTRTAVRKYLNFYWGRHKRLLKSLHNHLLRISLFSIFFFFLPSHSRRGSQFIQRAFLMHNVFLFLRGSGLHREDKNRFGQQRPRLHLSQREPYWLAAPLSLRGTFRRSLSYRSACLGLKFKEKKKIILRAASQAVLNTSF